MNRKIYRKTKVDKKRTIIKIIVTLAVSLLICVSAYGIYLIKQAESAVDTAYEPVGNINEDVEPLTDNISILFIGVDDSEQRNQSDGNIRSDALVLATLNNADKSIKLVSIPRDTYTFIPDAGKEDKITHAYALNGPSSTIESVEELLDVPVDYYLRMNFDAFIEVVDALGGIKVEVPYDITEQDENDSKNAIELKEGIQFLDGSEALALARTRHYDNDIERGKRQQMILESIMDRALSAGSITKYGDVFEAVGDNMKTDLSFQNMRALFEYAKDGKPDVETMTLDGYDDMSTGIYYWQLEQESLLEIQDVLQSHLGLKPDTSNLTDMGTNREIADYPPEENETPQ
ncbi:MULTISPECIES: LCP family protein [Planococcus]|uniref:Transcriptional regulator n=1 Tax=Planococcus faecalis TaxID=1598147 RepID=A0ABM6IU33_9BACL|nr:MULTISPECIES: LCP family protein [Planococcus]AQU80073.1 transcriptional regulator [Planococcus faecalis]MDJ0330555.1 LCP family protein [Planococcus sp. S3-L1]OHX52526.1 transcriptional regulator [Planococcus faecalis]